ncbi:MAG: BTAD domain-containing putative transcriptional regulator [Carbonactinosporaceae bacterium]
MQFRILGPLEVRARGRPLGLGGPRQRNVLAALLLNAGHTVTREWLIKALWGEDPPASAPRQVQNAVAALRQLLADSGTPDARRLIATDCGGYRLDAVDGQLDLHVFEHRLASARRAAAAGRVDEAAEGMRAGLGLWRGPALTGIPSRLLAGCGLHLDERRLSVQEECTELELDLGRHAGLIAELSALVAEHPLRERPVRHLMLAQYRAGRPGEALESYRQLRARLASELGIDPSPQLSQTHEAMLRGDPALAPPAAPVLAGVGYPHRPPLPAQLPPDIPDFTGRADALSTLSAFLPGPVESGGLAGARVVTISGTAGVGKTALAVHWAHTVREHFPDGQLYVSLRGTAADAPVAPAAALGQLLRALGAGTSGLPADLDERASLYRSVVAGRRLLVVLDDAASSAQVRPLLPGSPGCRVIVTSRSDLAGLAVLQGGRQITLGVMAPRDAAALVAGVIGDERAVAEPDAVAELARLCAGLPLALRSAAARLAARPHRAVTCFVASLAQGNLLDQLSVDDDAQHAVRAAMTRSYRRLAPGAARLFRLLGVACGREFSVDGCAALLDAPAADAEHLLEQLAAAHLVEQHAPGWYHCHELLRLYAQERSLADDSAHHREAAARRLRSWCGSAASRCRTGHSTSVAARRSSDSASRLRRATSSPAGGRSSISPTA